jgi:tetratricopeptide (TPR) repeat protein
MKAILQDYVPYDQSCRWRLHDAYYAQCGAAAWTRSEIPSFSTNNYAVARQHARLLVCLARELEAAGSLRPDEEVHVLEVGSGLGRFAANLFRALRTGCGPSGRRLARRLRYVLSDCTETSVGQAIRFPALRGLAASGRVVPALFDLARPQELVGLDGRAIQAPLTAVVANYVCCASPVKILRRTGEGYFEKFVRVEAEMPAGRGQGSPEALIEALLGDATLAGLMQGLEVTAQWRPVEPEACLPGALHAGTLRAALERFSEATLAYPALFFDLLDELRSRMKRGGVVLVNDYGSAEILELEGLNERGPQQYGNSLSHAINFGLFDLHCKAAGLGLVRTRSPMSVVHTAAIRYGLEVTAELGSAFRRAYVLRQDGDDLLDFSAAAQAALRQGQPDQAVRFYRRCLRLVPGSTRYLYQLGQACVEARRYRAALECLARGARRDRAGRWDFDFQLGRAYLGLRQYTKAVRAYLRSLEREEHPTTHANLGLAYEALGRRKQAYLAYRRSLELAPADARTRELLDDLRRRWREALAAPQAEPADVGRMVGT